jgi:hypothetical protein
MKKIIILMGLPASGKTTFSNSYIEKYKNNALYINLDNYVLHHKYNKYDKSIAIEKIVNDINIRLDYVIFDGLFLTNDSVFNVLNIILNRCSNPIEIEIHYWYPNIENCLWNDKYRRDEHSEITIKNAELEKIDLNLFNKLPNQPKINIIYHNVERKPEWLVFVDKYKILLKNGKMNSDSWCLGGTWRSYTGRGGDVSADVQPEFDMFDTLLEKINPNITYLKYKKLYNECIEIETYSESDYYGGRTENAYYSCDIKLLYERLIEMNIEIEL